MGLLSDLGLLSNVIKKSQLIIKSPTNLSFNLKHSCYDDCKWKCNVDAKNDVFCHLIGKDLTKDQIDILQQVGCFMWKRIERKEDLI